MRRMSHSRMRKSVSVHSTYDRRDNADGPAVEKKRIALEQLGAIERQFTTFRDR
jgi:hypothetical protein